MKSVVLLHPFATEKRKYTPKSRFHSKSERTVFLDPLHCGSGNQDEAASTFCAHSRGKKREVYHRHQGLVTPLRLFSIVSCATVHSLVTCLCVLYESGRSVAFPPNKEIFRSLRVHPPTSFQLFTMSSTRPRRLSPPKTDAYIYLSLARTSSDFPP